MVTAADHVRKRTSLRVVACYLLAHDSITRIYPWYARARHYIVLDGLVFRYTLNIFEVVQALVPRHPNFIRCKHFEGFFGVDACQKTLSTNAKLGRLKCPIALSCCLFAVDHAQGALYLILLCKDPAFAGSEHVVQAVDQVCFESILLLHLFILQEFFV